MRQWLNLLAVGYIVWLGAPAAPAQAAELIVLLPTVGTVSAWNELAPAFAQITGHKVIFPQEGAAMLEQKLSSTPMADLIVLNTSGMNDFIKRGKVVAGSSMIFARSAVGLSVKSGAPWPDISTPERFKQTMLSAKSIAYSRGGSGNVAARAMEKLGIAEQMKAKTTYAEAGPAAGYVARSEVEMAIQQINVSKPIAGTDYVGDLPAELHEYIVFAIGLMTASREPEAARALIKFVTSREARPLLQRGMMEPAS